MGGSLNFNRNTKSFDIFPVPSFPLKSGKISYPYQIIGN